MAARTQKTAASMIAMHRVDAPMARDTHVQDTSVQLFISKLICSRNILFVSSIDYRFKLMIKSRIISFNMKITI